VKRGRDGIERANGGGGREFLKNLSFGAPGLGLPPSNRREMKKCSGVGPVGKKTDAELRCMGKELTHPFR